MSERRGDWMQLHSGKAFWPLDPRPEEVEIDDIAWSLAHQCRYAGHCEDMYTVAQHSVLVSHACEPADALWGLLHDATEAYLVDVPRPVKKHLGGYLEIEAALARVIAARFDLPEEMPASVRHADEVLLATEKRDLMKTAPRPWAPMPPPLAWPIDPWRPMVAYTWFLRRFHELMPAREASR